MPSLKTLKMIQARSGIHFAIFLVMHLGCHMTLPLGWDVANGNLVLLRKLYQHKLFEILMLTSVLAHFYANAALYMARSKQSNKKEGGAPPKAGSAEHKAHQYAGYFLAMSIVGHVAAVRVGPLFVMDDPSQYDYGFVSKANELMPSHFFLVYLALLGMAGGWHMIYGVRSALATFQGKTVVGRPFPMALKVLALASHVGVVMGVLALGEFFYPIEHSEEKEVLHEQVFSAMGMH